ncbi:protein FAR1-RELATED SEQUENCE 5-like [Olea europaea var. sylvestris]|uniref:protein FAR1-RELATED SEQUENCE 5-like n=1 Tax=Olea europaea var. sylvestris TaxID=158386 RepID=UPI000C1CE011|nr:protein FAR1-RELATED SEQUENCE 5-like [Olea europaea var. sylvestris]
MNTQLLLTSKGTLWEEIMDEVQGEDDGVLAASDHENCMDSANIVEGETSLGDCLIVPDVGMEFKNLKDMFDMYKKYAYAVGFSVKKRNSKRGDDVELRYVTVTCGREGRGNENIDGSSKPQPTIQMGCKVRISASVDIYGVWRLNTVNLDHNHETSHSKSRLFHCNRELSAHVKRKLQVNDFAGIPLHKSYNSAVVEAGSYENMSCVEKDCRNYIEKVRRLRLGEVDVVAIQTYFSKMQARCSGFFFSMDLDNDSRLKNIFWADNRYRQAYKEFGDVVTFDITYLTNKYDMSFASFNMAPVCAWTSTAGDNQDRAMQNAIQIVFPNTRHRWCLWHILKKLSEKFGHHKNKASIFGRIHGLGINDTEKREYECIL